MKGKERSVDCREIQEKRGGGGGDWNLRIDAIISAGSHRPKPILKSSAREVLFILLGAICFLFLGL